MTRKRPTCHPARDYYAREKCQPCYLEWWRAKNVDRVRGYHATYDATHRPKKGRRPSEGVELAYSQQILDSLGKEG
jgi:hypothetical protein